MNKISQFKFKEQEIDLLVHKNEIGYSMTVDGKPYGLKVTVPSRKTQDIASSVLLLFFNIFETLEVVKKDVPEASS